MQVRSELKMKDMKRLNIFSSKRISSNSLLMLTEFQALKLKSSSPRTGVVDGHLASPPLGIQSQFRKDRCRKNKNVLKCEAFGVVCFLIDPGSFSKM